LHNAASLFGKLQSVSGSHNSVLVLQSNIADGIVCLITSANEVMFSSAVVCLFVC